MAALTGDLAMQTALIALRVAVRQKATPKKQPVTGRKRAQHTRSKRGCRVCRIRRVRCDLTKPFCTRCTSTGRKCEGYPLDILPPDASEAVSTQEQAPSANPARTLVPRAPPSTWSAVSSDELLHLDYFRSQTAAHFGGYLEDEFWGRFILQLTASDDCVRYVTIALGSLHRHFAHGGDTVGQHTGSLQQNGASSVYAKAVACLKSHIANQGWQKLEVTLVCCILCTGFEWLRGDPEAAFVHLSAGLNIFQQWQTSLVGGPSYWSPAGHFIRAKLAPFYTRLALQAETVLIRSPLPWTTLRTTNTTVEPFQSLQHARDSLCNLFGEMYLIPETYQLLRSQTPRSAKEHQRFETLFAQWSEHFEAYVVREHSTHPTPPSVIVLRLLHTAATVMLPNIFNDAIPEDTDANNHAFERMLVIAESLKNINLASFTIDLGWVAPLYYVATNCRRPQIRQKALDFLAQRPAREGLWSSQDAVLKVMKLDGSVEVR